MTLGCAIFLLLFIPLSEMQKISVIGGGLGGLAFAQGMRVIAGYQVTVYERDKSLSHRSQGYQIGLNEQGIKSLNKLNLPGFKDLLCENPLNGFMMTDHKLDPLCRFPIKNSVDNPISSLVNRWHLRDMLATGLDIQWDKKFVSYEEKNDCVVARFEDGTEVSSALLVGADGVNSKVRAQYRPDLAFEKTNITSVGGFFPYSLDTANELVTMKGVVENNLGRALLPHTNTTLFMKFIANDGQPNLLWSLSFDTSAGEAKFGPLPTELEEIRQSLVKRLTECGCSSELIRAVELTPKENFLTPNETVAVKFTPRAHERPKNLPPTKHRVVLLGDAAHAMTTHAGRGANTAFDDAIHLCSVIEDKQRDLYTPKWPLSHTDYEKFMFSRGMTNAKVSMENTRRIHKDNNEGGVKFMRFLGNISKSWNWITTGKYDF